MSAKFKICSTIDFNKWFLKQNLKTKLVIKSRLKRIEEDGHFGTINVFDEILELKWKSGLRVYTHISKNRRLYVLIGGTKNGQKKDIKRAKKIIQEIH